MKANSTRKLKKYKMIKKKRKEKEREFVIHTNRWCNYQQTTYSAATASRRQCLAMWNQTESRYAAHYMGALFWSGNPEHLCYRPAHQVARRPHDYLRLCCVVRSFRRWLCALCFCPPSHPCKANYPPTHSPSCVLGFGGRHARG